MTSAVVFWHYQRRLSQGNEAPREEPRTNMEVKTQRTRRLESESSVTGYEKDGAEDRRDSAAAGGDSTDEEALEHAHEEEKSKGNKRRFSLDFLFNRRKSKDKVNAKKLKSKRSQSTVEAHDSLAESNAENYRAYRYPGFGGAEFALAM